MKWSIVVALLCVPLFGMEHDPAKRAVGMLNSAERAVGQAEEKIEQLQKSWLVQWL